MRLIDADALIELIPKTSQSKFENCWTCKLLSAETVKKIINSAPTIDIVRCDDLIRRADAIMHFVKASKTYGCRVFDLEEISYELWRIPSAQPKQGEWVYNPNAYDYGLPAWECDQCGCINANIPPRIMTKDSKPNYAPINPNDFSGSNFCPNCGARMKTQTKTQKSNEKFEELSSSEKTSKYERSE